MKSIQKDQSATSKPILPTIMIFYKKDNFMDNFMELFVTNFRANLSVSCIVVIMVIKQSSKRLWTEKLFRLVSLKIE